MPFLLYVLEDNREGIKKVGSLKASNLSFENTLEESGIQSDNTARLGQVFRSSYI